MQIGNTLHTQVFWKNYVQSRDDRSSREGGIFTDSLLLYDLRMLP